MALASRDSPDFKGIKARTFQRFRLLSDYRVSLAKKVDVESKGQCPLQSSDTFGSWHADRTFKLDEALCRPPVVMLVHLLSISI